MKSKGRWLLMEVQQQEQLRYDSIIGIVADIIVQYMQTASCDIDGTIDVDENKQDGQPSRLMQ